MRTGRASAHLLDPVQVDAYGTHMPIVQVATVSVPEPRMISVSVWDKSLVHAVEKAITNANLGLNPQTEGQTIRLRIPELNEERRKELVKVAHKYAEAARVAVRHVRRDAHRRDQEAGKGSQDQRGRSRADLRRDPESHRSDDPRRRPDACRPRKRKSSRFEEKGAKAIRCPDPTPHPARSTASRFRAMSPSSWTATAAGRRRADCRAARGIAAASRRCGRRCARPAISASRC